MTHELIFAGFGGQGVLLLGQLAAYAAMLDAKQVSWMPSYGPEMRGGTANCSVIISEEIIGSPIVGEPTAVLSMSNPALEKFEPTIKPGGILVINTSLVTIQPQRTDLRIISVPATALEAELGIAKAMNIIMFGAFIKATAIASEQTIYTAFAKRFAAQPHTIEPNKQAFLKGFNYI